MTVSDPVRGLHNVAHCCRDAEKTRKFYENILGLPLVHIVREDGVPSTGGYCAFVHLLFQMKDDPPVAYLDLGDDEKAEPWSNTPAWTRDKAKHQKQPVQQ